MLCFDYGDLKIGLAVGNSMTGNAQELATLPWSKQGPDWAALDRIVQEWQPGHLLVGLPLNLDGTESNQSRKARAFGTQLARRYRLPVDFEDERLSTCEADRLVRESLEPGQGLGRKAKLRRDQVAARLILESYIARI